MEPLLPLASARTVIDAILGSTGCQWRQLPKDFPPYAGEKLRTGFRFALAVCIREAASANSDLPNFLRSLIAGLPQTDSGAAAILVDELDAGGFKSSPNDVERRASWLAAVLLELMNRHNTDARSIGQSLLAPTE